MLPGCQQPLGWGEAQTRGQCLGEGEGLPRDPGGDRGAIREQVVTGNALGVPREGTAEWGEQELGRGNPVSQGQGTRTVANWAASSPEGLEGGRGREHPLGRARALLR